MQNFSGPKDDDNYVILLAANQEAKLEPYVTTSLGFEPPAGPIQARVAVDEKNDAIEGISSNLVPPPLSEGKAVSAGKRLMKNASENNDEGSEGEGDDFFDDVSLEKLKQQHKPTETEMVVEPTENDVDNISDDGMGDASYDHKGSSTVREMMELLNEREHFPLTSKIKSRGYKAKIPDSFQPASTYQHKKTTNDASEDDEDDVAAVRRQWVYLVWNAVGSITCLNESTNNRIEISFSDVQGPNKAISFEDTDMFTRGALSEYGAAFTSDISEEDGDKVPSVIFYRAFHSASLQANESFRYTLPSGEGAIAVACGRGFVAVVTTKKFLRVFSTTGIQLSVTVLKGPLLTLVGGENCLAILWYSGSQLDKDQSLMVKVTTDCTRCCQSHYYI